MSEYILMHKNIEVALMELDENDRNAKPMKISINNREKTIFLLELEWIILSL